MTLRVVLSFTLKLPINVSCKKRTINLCMTSLKFYHMFGLEFEKPTFSSLTGNYNRYMRDTDWRHSGVHAPNISASDAF